ncbi:MAG: RagB/SusD family nutrient uptake outer membrane protein [Prevotella sp.]|jgi:hypothetical protein|nr:RagB/SusD family nutrient uptake outer membrane protein [Prevotella sp.]
MNKKYFISCLLALALLGSACNDFLDVVPDDRVELATEKKLNQLLAGSYPRRMPYVYAEYMSDNHDHKIEPITLDYYYLWLEEAYLWKDVKDESGNDDPKDYWAAAYSSIGAANQIIQSIQEQGDPAEFLALKGEALLLRAFNHFLLVNIYGKHYCEATAENDMGIVYIESTETELNPHYERISVAEVYRKINADIEEGLPLIKDEIYTYPKYRFNRQASLAFAVRFNAYYGNYDKVIGYANQLFGADPEPLMRNKQAFPLLTRDFGIFTQQFNSLGENANFLIVTPVSTGGNLMGNSSRGKLYMPSLFIANHETIRSNGPWGTYNSSVPYTFNIHSSFYSGTSGNYVAMPVIYQKMEVTNPVAGTGVNHCSIVAFWTEETLLCRAEAYIVKGEYDKATADLALWMKYQVNPSRYATPLTRDQINTYYSGLAYYEPDKPTPKKELNPLNFELEKGGEQENFMHCLLHFRRIETMHLGLRWFDVKRFGIEIYRRDIKPSGSSDEFVKSTDFLLLNDPRRAAQIPPDVISAGMTPTPR